MAVKMNDLAQDALAKAVTSGQADSSQTGSYQQGRQRSLPDEQRMPNPKQMNRADAPELSPQGRAELGDAVKQLSRAFDAHKRHTDREHNNDKGPDNGKGGGRGR